MPYEVRKNGDKYEVINKDTQEVKATHDDKEKAERQVRLLHEVEENEGWK